MRSAVGEVSAASAVGTASRARRRRLAGITVAVLLPGILAISNLTWSALNQSDWPQPVDEYVVETSDGWSLHVARVRPSGPPLESPPVLLVHGLSTNGRNLDFAPGHSPARFLASQGFDVFVPSLRGTGPGREGPANTARDFDAFVTFDAPALIAFAQRESGSASVDWVGHSMGGLVGYAHLAAGGGGVRRIVTLGSPVRFDWEGGTGELLKRALEHADISGLLPLRVGSLFLGPLHGSVKGPLETLIVDLENVPPAVWRRFLAVGVEDIPSPLAAQFAEWSRAARFGSRNGDVDYLGGLTNVTIPALVIAGAADGIAPPPQVRPAFDALGGPKQWRVVGRENGATADYNHMDLVLGIAAERDVLSHIVTFLSGDVANDVDDPAEVVIPTMGGEAAAPAIPILRASPEELGDES